MALKEELLLILMRRVDTSSQDTVLADVIAIWHTLLGEFSPLIGPSSVQLLFLRSLDASRASYPWIAPLRQENAADPSFSAFEEVLATRPPEEVAGVTRAMLDSFIGALFKLIGPTLTSQFVLAAFREDRRKK